MKRFVALFLYVALLGCVGYCVGVGVNILKVWSKNQAQIEAQKVDTAVEAAYARGYREGFISALRGDSDYLILNSGGGTVVAGRIRGGIFTSLPGGSLVGVGSHVHALRYENGVLLPCTCGKPVEGRFESVGVGSQGPTEVIGD